VLELQESVIGEQHLEELLGDLAWVLEDLQVEDVGDGRSGDEDSLDDLEAHVLDDLFWG
jgi:hypothetical protein